MSKSTLEKFNEVVSWLNLIVVGIILAMVIMAMSGCERGEAKQAAPTPLPDNLLMQFQEVSGAVYRGENSEAVCYVYGMRGGISCFRK